MLLRSSRPKVLGWSVLAAASRLVSVNEYLIAVVASVRVVYLIITLVIVVISDITIL